MPKTTQFCVGLANRPGSLAKLCAALSRAKVNIDAISVADSHEGCWVRFLATPAPKADRALRRGRFTYSSQPVLRVRVGNTPGALKRIATRLAKAGVNINYVYGSAGVGESSTLVISADNPARASRAIGR